MSALQRTLGAYKLWLGLWLGALALTQLSLLPARLAFHNAMEGLARHADGHALAALVELIARNSAVVEGASTAGFMQLALAQLLAFGLAPALIWRLQPTENSEPFALFAQALRLLPGNLVQSLYALLPRVLLLLPAIAIARSDVGRPAAPLFVGIALALGAWIAEATRAELALGEGRRARFHPRVFVRALRWSIRPRASALGWVGLWLLQALVAATLAPLVFSDLLGAAAIWSARGALGLGLFLALWRSSLVAHSYPQPDTEH